MRTELSTSIEQAVALLRAGEAVVVPTETVYGLAADALNPAAVAKVFEAKERPFFDPLICHLPEVGWLNRLARVPEESKWTVEKLRLLYWPGPLTMVLPRQPLVPDLVTAGLETVALRYPEHPMFQAVLKAFGGPLAAPSANRFGRLSPTSAAAALAELDERIPLVLDGGPCALGLESTIVAFEGEAVRMLRPGPISREELEEHFELPASEERGLEAPGQMPSHYAPRTPMAFSDAPASGREGLLAWREARPGFAAVEILSPAGDLREAGATLFAKLRRLDALGLERIVCEPVPERGLGVAIMDRLRKGAARP